jgi:putative membrane protein
MNKLFEIIKGMFIGLANIIPGVSGGTMAVIFKIYDRLINAIADIYKTPIKSFKSLIYILIGMGLGVILGVFGISYGYEKVPFITVFIFVGLILGGLNPIYKMVDRSFYRMPNIIGFLIAFTVVVGLPLLKTSGSIQSGFIYYIMLFLVGMITAITMIAPGISGSMVLLIIGYYTHILDLAKQTIEAVVTFDIQTVLNNLFPIILLVLGFVFGAILFSKLIKLILVNFETMFYSSILGLLVASPIAIIYLLNETNPILNTPMLEVIIGLVLMTGAAYLAYVIIKQSENEESKTSERNN